MGYNFNIIPFLVFCVVLGAIVGVAAYKIIPHINPAIAGSVVSGFIVGLFVGYIFTE